MERLNKAELIEQFLAISHPWVAGDMTARRLISDFVSFYRDFRVTDVDSEEGDKLFHYTDGASQHHLIDRPTNLIDARDSELAWSTERYRHIGLSRELWPPEGVWDEDDDDDVPEEFAVGLSLFMYFNPPTDANLSSSDYTISPDDLEKPLAAFLERRLVKELLDELPTKVTAFASGIG